MILSLSLLSFSCQFYLSRFSIGSVPLKSAKTTHNAHHRSDCFFMRNRMVSLDFDVFGCKKVAQQRAFCAKTAGSCVITSGEYREKALSISETIKRYNLFLNKLRCLKEWKTNSLSHFFRSFFWVRKNVPMCQMNDRHSRCFGAEAAAEGFRCNGIPLDFYSKYPEANEAFDSKAIFRLKIDGYEWCDYERLCVNRVRTPEAVRHMIKLSG